MPTLIIVGRLAPYMFAFLWGTTLACLFILNRMGVLVDIWRWRTVNWHNMRPILGRWVLLSLLLAAFVEIYDPARSFSLIQDRQDLWVKIMVFYPFLSALPQEFIFCTYFFARFAPLFPKTKHMVLVSAVVFAYAHVLFFNPVAPILGLIAGYIFATTYARHRSLALVAIEHALYGNMIFTVGLGWYFWHGSVG